MLASKMRSADIIASSAKSMESPDTHGACLLRLNTLKLGMLDTMPDLYE
jgi:hypothetical protein